MNTATKPKTLSPEQIKAMVDLFSDNNKGPTEAQLKQIRKMAKAAGYTNPDSVGSFLLHDFEHLGAGGIGNVLEGIKGIGGSIALGIFAGKGAKALYEYLSSDRASANAYLP